MKTVDLLDAVKASHRLESDYAAAMALGLTRSQVSRYRSGKDFMGDDVAARAAELAGFDPQVAVAHIHAERARDPSTRALWQSIADRLARAGLGALAALVVAFFGVTPDGGAMAKSLDGQALTEVRAPALYIMSTRIRVAVRQWLARWLSSLPNPAPIPASC